jgi:putative endonuclease
MREHVYCVYILASRRNGTLYVGVTNNLVRRVKEHREGLVAGFTKRHGVKLLVYYEVHTDIGSAILREKRIKRWHRRWKLALIEGINPQWANSGRRSPAKARRPWVPALRADALRPG